jgi:fused signal recognition particle receptor
VDPIYFIIGGIALVAIVAFFLLRRKPAALSGDRTPELPPKKELDAKDLVPEPKRQDEKVARKPEKEPKREAKVERPEREGEAARVEEAKPAKAKDATPAPAKRATAADVEALKKGLESTRGGFVARLARLFRKKEIDPALLDEIEEVLITADIGVNTSQKVLGNLRERLAKKELADEDRVWAAIREEAQTILDRPKKGDAGRTKPTVIVVVGVNGVGKTTTIGKLASRFKEDGKKVILAAGDTFRAAAVLQLEVWGKRVGCEVVRGKERADPSSVIFEAIQKARNEGADIVIADTAGRLHTKTPLMEELKKVYRIAGKARDGADPDEVLLVLDSTNGQNAIQQVAMFKDALPITGIVLTKLDGTAKGGVILGIVDEHSIPVRYIGIGERVEDLREFDAESFVAALFDKPDDASAAA